MNVQNHISKMGLKPGQDGLEHGDWPPLQSLGEDGVVGVGTALHRHIPGLHHSTVSAHMDISGQKSQIFTYGGPVERLLVHEDPHELGYGQGRVGVVQLDGHLLRHLGEVGPGHLPDKKGIERTTSISIVFVGDKQCCGELEPKLDFLVKSEFEGGSGSTQKSKKKLKILKN